MLSYNQAFVERYLQQMKQLAIMLRGKCNAGEVYSDKQVMMLDLFSMWLVQQGIANLLSIACLKRDGHRIPYDSLAD